MKTLVWLSFIFLILAPAHFPVRTWKTFSPPPDEIGEAVQINAGGKAPTYEGCGGQIAPAVNPTYEQQVLDLVNQARAENGLPPLKLTPELVNSARYHATDMGQDNYFTHDLQDRQGGNLVVVCSWSTRISSYYTNWNALAENIAAGYTTPENVMNGWMNSTGHRANILSPNSREIGIGYYEGSGSYYRYWVQNFGRRSSVYPLLINSDQASTNDPNVTLYIYGEGTWNEMRLRNDEGEWSNWQPFQATITWQLTGPLGDHTVWAELKNATQTITINDSIFLTVNAALPTLGGLPDSASFVFSIPNNTLYPKTILLAPQNVGTNDILSWSIASTGDWFEVSPLTGNTPATVTITPTSYITDTLNTYTGSLTLTVNTPPGTLNTPHSITLTLQIVDYSPYFFYLPVMIK